MVKEIRVYTWYLALAIIYSILAILSAVAFISPQLVFTFAYVWMPIVLIWILLNIVLLIVFWFKKVEKIALLIPAFYIIDFFLSIITGIILGAIAIANNIPFDKAMQNPIGIILSLIFPVLALLLSIKLIIRKKK